MNTREAAAKWNCSIEDVRDWCRKGAIPGAEKAESRSPVKPWIIPDNAKRPIDRRLQQEIVWRVLEKKNNPNAFIDLTIWDIADGEILGYLDATIPLLVRKARPNIELVASVGDLEVTEAGFRLIGRGGSGDVGGVPELLTWSASFAGTFAASFLRTLAFGSAADFLLALSN